VLIRRARLLMGKQCCLVLETDHGSIGHGGPKWWPKLKEQEYDKNRYYSEEFFEACLGLGPMSYGGVILEQLRIGLFVAMGTAPRFHAMDGQYVRFLFIKVFVDLIINKGVVY